MIAGAEDKFLRKFPVPADARGERVFPMLRKVPRWQEKIIVAGVDVQRIEIRELQPFAIDFDADLTGGRQAFYSLVGIFGVTS